MEWFEKEYKKRFEEESSIEGVDANLLWNQISESIPQKKPVSPYWKWSLMSAILIGVVAIWVFMQKEKSTNDLLSSQSYTTIQSTDDIQENNIDNKEVIANPQVSNFDNVDIVSNKNIQENTNNKEINPQDNNSDNEDQFSNESKQENIIKNSAYQKDIKTNNFQNLTSSKANKGVNDVKTSQRFSNNTNNSTTSNIPNRNTSITESNPKSNSIQDQAISSKTNSKEAINTELASESNQNNQLSSYQNPDKLSNTYDSKNKDVIEDNKMISSIDEVILNTSDSKKILEIGMLDLPSIGNLHKQKAFETAPMTPQVIIAKTKNPFAINIQSSANFFDLNYSDDLNPELFANEANESLGLLQIGNTFALNIDYNLNHSWSIGTGIELNNYENKLDKVITLDTTQFDGQKVRKAKFIRTVKHHNKLSTYTIPLNLTYENRVSDRWSVGTSIGASYSIIKSQRGRLLGRNNMILDYTDQENNQFNNFLSLRIKPFLRYGISNKVSISMNAGLSIQNHGQAEAQDLKQSSKIYNLGLGLHYKM